MTVQWRGVQVTRIAGGYLNGGETVVAYIGTVSIHRRLRTAPQDACNAVDTADILHVAKKSIPIPLAMPCQSQLLSSFASMHLQTSSSTSSARSVFLSVV